MVKLSLVLLIACALAGALAGCSTATVSHPQPRHVTRRTSPVQQDEAAAIAVGYVYGQGEADAVDVNATRVSDAGQDWRVEFRRVNFSGFPGALVVAVKKASGVPRWIPVE